jgi:hypothetical protein
MNAMVARPAMLSVLITAAGPVLAAGPSATATERFHCYRIRTGDSATDVAQHLTGRRGDLSGSSFEVFDAQRRLVPRARYDSIAPGWTVCRAEGRSPATLRTSAPAIPPVGVQRTPPVADVQSASYDPDVWWFASLVLAATSILALNSWRKQLAVAQIMRRFGDDFVQEFERPWTRYRGARALPRARVRIDLRKSRMEILVAPSPGRTYPNLTDHRSNVEYDVVRITTALKQTAFAGVQPYAEGEWVVLPFQFKGRVAQEGDR